MKRLKQFHLSDLPHLLYHCNVGRVLQNVTLT
jgi:hypothetical protein